jgi:cytochrome c oxidase cbb3-type subunit III
VVPIASGWAAVGFVALTMLAQNPTPPAAPPTPAPQAPEPAPGRGQGRGGGRGPATFPAQQRPPGDPQLIARGKTVYEVNCQSCHGVDLRGGDRGGSNLLRAQVVLSDQDGELIRPIVRGSLRETGMPAINLGDDDVKAVATYIHSIVATARGAGAPPATGAPPPSILVGDATAGQTYFAGKCASCHSPTGDLQGLAARVPDPKALQNLWVSGGGGRGGRGAASDRRTVTVTVTQPSGEKIDGRLLQIDDFLVTLMKADGTVSSFRRDGDRPKVDVHDPMQAHRALLAVLTDKDMHDVTAFLATLK